MAHNLARWTARIGLGEQIVTTKTLRRRFFALPDASPARHAASPCIFPSAGPGKPSSVAPWPGCEPFHSQPDGQPAADPTSPQTRDIPVRESSLLRILSPSRASQLSQAAIRALCGG